MSAEIDRGQHAVERAGMLTASMADTIVNGSAKAKNSLLRALWDSQAAAEAFAAPSTGARKHGHETERYAASVWWGDNPLIEFEKTEFCRHHLERYSQWVGASPDILFRHLIGEDTGILEVKCPYMKSSWKSYQFLYDQNRFPAQHHAQVQWQLWVTGRDFAVLVVYWHQDKTYVDWLATPDKVLHERFSAAVEEWIPHLVKGHPFEDMNINDIAGAL